MTGGFFDQRRSEDRIANGRYQLSDPETGERASWQRASNFGYPLSDHFGLQRWRHREILKGLAARPDLVHLLQAMHATGEWDRGKLDEVLQTALEVAGATSEANEGTAIHDALRAADQGREYPDWAEPYVRSYRSELSRHGLSVVLRERLVLNRALGVAGRVDAIYRTADGRFVVGDVKTTTHLDLQEHEIAVQVGAYAGAEWLEGDDGALHRLDAWNFDRLEAVVVHVSREHATAAVYRLTLPLAQHGVNLAAQVRDWRTVRGLLLPYVRPAATVPVEVAPTLQSAPVRTEQSKPDEGQRRLRVIRPAPSPNPRDPAEIASDHPGLAPVVDAPDVRAAQAPGEAAGALPGLGDEGAQPDSGYPLKTADELMKLDKPRLQQYGRERGVTDLAHNRKVLVVIFIRAGIVAEPSRQDPPETARDLEDPRSDQFRKAALLEVANARSVGDLGRMNRRITSAYGDAAWTDELTEAARRRVAELDATADARAELVSRVDSCQSQKAVSDLWEEVTVGGSAPERWTPEVQQAANDRLAAIRAALGPPASNPFAG